MTKRMLIDAAHPEQTRVAIVDGNRVEEFDFESQNKKQLRGNIYLAKVTRVEASLQAAFVDFGGNRHGFLAFNEIHPDYYQIPVEDRQKLLEEEAAAEAEDLDIDEHHIDEETDDPDHDTDAAEEAQIAHEAIKKREKRRRNNYRRYKIQEVIKHGQVMLVQVVKEERGTKGAALTSYMSLAGRYCVLMPNTAKGGGISRKISNTADRKRLKGITSDLDIAAGMGLIIRTAGAKRNKTEIKRDYDYLTRLWGIIREKTLQSSAPTLVHEEGGLVRRAVRDLYGKDIEAVIVEGEEAYNDAKAFMKMLMPSHSERVKHYQEKHPIFLRYQVEDQLETIHSPEVQLKSGGYLVIHQTEALVAIDVNSGRATKERNIEATALKTNLEAAEESCRQMRLRDLAGLIVIDFIDMEENKNNRAVEKRMKDSLKRDRARVQAGRISMFGLFEMSRQRRRASVIEGTSQTCPTCNGLGVVRSIESSALQALQALESEGMRKRSAVVKLTAPSSVALYILNEKRSQLNEIENQSGMRVLVATDLDMHPPQHEIDMIEPLAITDKNKDSTAEDRPKRGKRRGRKPKAEILDNAKPQNEKTDEDSKATEDVTTEKPESTEPKRRRRGRRGGRNRSKEVIPTETSETTTAETAPAAEAQSAAPADEATKNSKPKRKTRRRKKAVNSETATIEPIADTPEETKTDDADKQQNAGLKRRVRRPRRSKKAEPTQVSEPKSQDNNKSEVSVTDNNETDRPKRVVRKRRSVGTSEETSQNKEPKAPKTSVKRKTAPVEEKTAKSAKKTGRTVRKRPPAKKTVKEDVTADAPVKAPKTEKKPTRKRTPAVKKADAKTTESDSVEKAPAVRKTRTRRKPAANVKVNTEIKKTAKPKPEVQKIEPAPKPTEVQKPEPTEEQVAKPAVKKSKRSWRSRIFGSDESS